MRRAARRRDRHAALDAVLRFEVAARQILGAGERHERELALLPERQHRVLERRMQAPRHRVVRPRERDGGAADWPGSGFGQRDRRPRLVVEVAADRNDDVGGVVAAAQKHEQELRVGGARRGKRLRHDAADRQQRMGGADQRQLQQVAT